jgi:hypothetical protein
MVAGLIQANTDISVIDMDGLIFGGFMAAYQPERHPAATYWFGAANPLDRALSLSWEAFDSLNRASNAEFLDLLSKLLARRAKTEALLIEGGFTHPSVLTQVVPASTIVCLQASDQIRFECWETAEERADMKRWINDLEDGEAKWRKFLYFDKMIAETLVAESQLAGITIIERREASSGEAMAKSVQLALGLRSSG